MALNDTLVGEEATNWWLDEIKFLKERRNRDNKKNDDKGSNKN